MRGLLCSLGLSLVLMSAAALSVAADHAAQAHTDKGCGEFTWDVSRELAVMGQPAREATSGDKLELGERYALALQPQQQVKFAVSPERPPKSAAPRAATVKFSVTESGRYRISLTTRHWIDVVDGDKVIASADHQGRSGCQLMHKVVEFQLPAGRELTLQLSGQDDASVGLAITAPAASP